MQINIKSVSKVCIEAIIGICALAICYVIGNQFCKDCFLFYDGGLQFGIGMVSGVFAVAIGNAMVKIISVAYGNYGTNGDNDEPKTP